ncbi:hypothetical protein [Variovorax sp. UC122_21]|uniref:hypothetical protein n=1 Tax=Variovorax sp. UC122_21 TaxID=3374554 RepID=UPI003756DCE3
MTTRILADGLRALLLLLLTCALQASAQSAKPLKKVTLAVGGVSVLTRPIPGS